MLTILKSQEGTLQALDQPIEGCWINVIDPTAEEMKQLEGLGVPYDFLIYSVDLDERARMEREDGEMLILLRIPYFQGKSADIPYATIPLGMIMTPRFLVTVCKFPNQILSDLTSKNVRGLSTAKRYRFILRILLTTANAYLNSVRTISKAVDLLEDQLQKSTRNKEVLELLKYQKSLTIFTTALKSNELMLKRLEQIKLFNAYPEDQDLLDDVLIETEQAIEMTNIESNILSSMMDAFASIISNNLNGVMKFLASITILVSVPSTVAAFFGMNVDVPLDTHYLGFAIIIALAVGLTAIVAFYFFRRDWL
jgi:magnesium transporter